MLKNGKCNIDTTNYDFVPGQQIRIDFELISLVAETKPSLTFFTT
jgi:hypothetical protein